MNTYYKTLLRASSFNLFLGAAAIFFEAVFDVPRIQISTGFAVGIFIVMMLVYSLIAFEVVLAYSPSEMGHYFPHMGPYAKSRHPMYAAIIFILNPAVAILLKSYLLFIAIVPAYVIWRLFADVSEKKHIREFGHAYAQYLASTPRFFPMMKKKNIGTHLGYFIIMVCVLFVFLYGETYVGRWIFIVRQELSYDLSALPANTGGNTKIGGPLAGDAPAQEGAPIPQDVQFIGREIRIPKIGVVAPIVLTQSAEDKIINGLLNEGAVMYPSYALPENGGSTLLIGHSSVYPWNRTPYGRIFSLLDRLQTGDTISVISSGKEYTYAVSRKEIISDFSQKGYEKISNAPKGSLMLVTCWPPGTTLKRYLVVANPVQAL